MIVDHGFRVLDDDPYVLLSVLVNLYGAKLTGSSSSSMFGNPYGWSRQSYRTAPEDLQNTPYNYQPGYFQKRDNTAVAGRTTTNNATDPSADDGGGYRNGPPVVCHADPNSQNANANEPADAELDYENLLFVDVDGNRVDGRSCDVIYDEDDPNQPDGSKVRIIIDEDGNMVDMYMGEDGAGDGLWRDEGATVTTEAEAVTVTATMEGARPGSGEATTAAFPASTAVRVTKRGSVVTLPPF